MVNKGCQLITTEKEFGKNRGGRASVNFYCKCQSSIPESDREIKATTVNSIIKKANSKTGLCRSCSFTGRFNTEIASEIFREKGCELLSPYINNKSKLTYRCKNGHVNNTSLQTFTHSDICCKRCLYSKQNEDMWPKVKECIESQKGHVLISTVEDYTTRDSPLKYRCKYCRKIKEVSYGTASHVVSGETKWKGCNECTKKKFRIQPDVLKALFEDQECELLTPTSEYKSNTQKLKYRCICGSDEHEISYKRFKKGSRCPGCAWDRRAKTNIKLYGTENVFASPIIMERIRATLIRKFGVPHCMQLKEIALKAQATNLEKYGYKYKFCDPEILEKGRQICEKKFGHRFPLQCPAVQEKIKATFQRMFGADYPIGTAKFAELIRKKYGVEIYVLSNDYKVKMKTRFGNECIFKTEHFKDVMVKKFGNECIFKTKYFKDFMVEKFGVEHAMQNPELMLKALTSGFRFKEYCFPSGKIEKVQGYEPKCLNFLLEKCNIKEDDIAVGPTKVPRIPYLNPETKRQSYYFPDIYIESLGLIIEVKSPYTYEKELEKNKAKFRACRRHFYQFQLYIYIKTGLAKVMGYNEIFEEE